MPDALRIAQAGAAHALTLEGVSRVFGALVALDAVDLTIDAGERRGILGANGAGKTTLFNAITGDFPPTAGSVRFFGEDITRWPPHERIRRGLRRIYQNSMLFRGLSVLDNLYLASCGATRGRLSLLRPRQDNGALVAARELAHMVRLDTVADRMVADLSPGERRELVQILGALPRHIGFIIIEHDLDVALRVVERVTVMHGAKIFKHGTPAEIQGDPDVQRIYLGDRHG